MLVPIAWLSKFQGVQQVRSLCAIVLIVLLFSPPGLVAETTQKSQALVSAAMSGDVARINDLLAQGVDANSVNPSGRTPLHIAAFNGNLKSTKALLAAGADPNLADNRGITPIMEASAFGHLKIVRLLLQRGVDVNAADQAGNTALGLSNRGKHEAVSAVLTEMGAVESKPKDAK
jgi:ankyrin repeat protein